MGCLYAYGSHLFSYGRTGWVGPTQQSVDMAALDGTLGSITSLGGVDAAIIVNLGASRSPDFVALGNHNITGTCHLSGADDPTFQTRVVTQAITPSGNFWYDLRSTSPRAAQYWAITVSGNTSDLTIGALMVGTFASIRTYQWGYEDSRHYLEFMRGATVGGVYRDRLGEYIRARRVTYKGDRAMEQVLWAMVRSGGHTPVLWVPDDSTSDIWFLDLVTEIESKQELDNFYEVSVTHIEQASSDFTKNPDDCTTPTENWTGGRPSGLIGL